MVANSFTYPDCALLQNQCHGGKGRECLENNNENIPFIQPCHNASPTSTLDYYPEKNYDVRASSTSSFVSSLDDPNVPPSCFLLDQRKDDMKSVRRSSPRLAQSYPVATKQQHQSAPRKRKPPQPKSLQAPKRRRAAPNKKCVFTKAALETLKQWIPVGQPFAEKVFVFGEEKSVCCYPAVKNIQEDFIFNTLDVVCVPVGGRASYGKIDRIYLDDKEGMMMNIYWYYQYDQCVLSGEAKKKIESRYQFHAQELIASKHLDTIYCDNIQCLAYAITFSEYARFCTENKFDALPTSIQNRSKELWPRGDPNYSRRRFLPHDDTPNELVFFCRKYYSIAKKAILSGAPRPHGKRSNRLRPPANNGLIFYDQNGEDDSENRNGKTL